MFISVFFCSRICLSETDFFTNLRKVGVLFFQNLFSFYTMLYIILINQDSYIFFTYRDLYFHEKTKPSKISFVKLEVKTSRTVSRYFVPSVVLWNLTGDLSSIHTFK